MCRRLFLIAVLLLAGTVCATAQTSPADSLFRIAQARYDDGDFDGAELAALRGLRAMESADILDRLKFHLMLGFVYVARDQNADALREFDSVFTANPAYHLDPVQTPPKILEIFDEAHTAYMDRITSIPERLRQPQADVRMAASWRSLVAPGWGQFYKKQDTKGSAIIAAQVLSLAALIYMQVETNHRHDDYTRIRNYGNPNVEDAYQEYRRAYQTRNVVGYITLSIYALNYLDALYAPVLKKLK
ncbi:hypothetical protein EHM69_02885 [candidate division KSB1 bacterium]|nr:MAG: hypothetical protein EHM69_02885 [candidate division KSB1 bacterium]